MDACSHCWSRYMEAMDLSRRISDQWHVGCWCGKRMSGCSATSMQRIAKSRGVRGSQPARVCRGEQLRRS